MFHLRPKPPRTPDPIDLHLPRSWNALTIDQLERICKLLISTANHDREHPESPTTRTSFLTSALMELADLEPVSIAPVSEAYPSGIPTSEDDTTADISTLNSIIHTTIDCQFRDEAKRRRLQTFDGKICPISISTIEIMTLATGYDDGIDPHSKKPIHHDGQLEWLLKPSRLTNFPYPEYKVGEKVYRGPSPMMADVSWRQYRFSSNILSELIKGENMLVKLQHKLGNTVKDGSAAASQLSTLQSNLNQARAQWLANLFTLPVAHIDPETQQPVTDYYYVSDQYERNYKDFLDFPDYKYQAVSLWWQGMIEHLARTYPKVFSRDTPDKNARPADALTVYTRSTATMMKYIGGTEQEVNQTQYTIILQHIQDMADENDRIKEISKKK